jgi:hypothetical protein
MKLRRTAALAIALLVAGCAPTPLADSSRSIRELAEEHYPAWCFLSPPTNYSKVEVEADAPLLKWGLGSCYESLPKCEMFLAHVRWRAWFGEQSPGGSYPGPAITAEQLISLSRKSAYSSICISIEDSRLRNNESLRQYMQM